MGDIARNVTVEKLVDATNVGVTGVDDKWINIGDPFLVATDDRLVLYYDLVVHNSLGVQLRVVPRKTESGDPYPAYNSALDTWALGATDEKKWLQFNSESFVWMQIQCKATTVGATPGTLAIDFTRVKVQ